MPSSAPRLHPGAASLSHLLLTQPISAPLLGLVSRSTSAQPELPLGGPPELIVPESLLDARTRAVTTTLVAALVEAISGRRPPHQLGDWVSSEVLTLVEQLARAHRGIGVTLRSIRVQSPRSGVVEVSAHLTQDGRSRAAAIRLVQSNRQWQATGLAIALRANRINQAGGAA